MDKLKRTYVWLAILNILFFAGMITVNALANALPINGLNTGEVSAAYPNLFVPAGLTFAIWGVIYALLFVYVVYALIAAVKNSISGVLGLKTQIAFALTCVLNAGWIFLWHYQLIVWSEIVMIALLATLIYLFLQTNALGSKGGKQYFYVKIPVQVYLGWITVATIANTTAMLVTKNWGAWGIPENVWAITLILIGAGITVIMLLKHYNIAYTLVVIWAYTGIIIKRANADIVHKDIILTAALAIALLLIGVIYTVIRNTRKTG